MRRIRYAVIGCGDHALQSHIIPGLKVPELELVGVCDPNNESIRLVQEAVAEHHTLRVYHNEDQIWQDALVDAVLIASPDQFHVGSLHDAVMAGKHVLCEKPMVSERIDMQVLNGTISRAEADGLVITSCHPRRFDPPYVWLKEQIAAQADEQASALGNVLSIHLDFSYHRPSRGKAGLHHGLLIDHVSHEFDLLTFLFGRDKNTWLKRLKDSQTHYQVVGQRADGISFFFEGSRCLKESVYPEFVHLRFERGEIRLNCKSGGAVIDHHGNERTEEIYGLTTNYCLRFYRVMENWAKAILGQEENYLAPEDLLDNTYVGIVLNDLGECGP